MGTNVVVEIIIFKHSSILRTCLLFALSFLFSCVLPYIRFRFSVLEELDVEKSLRRNAKISSSFSRASLFLSLSLPLPLSVSLSLSLSLSRVTAPLLEARSENIREMSNRICKCSLRVVSKLPANVWSSPISSDC